MIVDVHVHVLPERLRQDLSRLSSAEPWFAACHAGGKRTASVESALRAMDAYGVERAVFFTWPFIDPQLCQEGNDYIAAAQAAHPQRVIGFGTVQPASPDAGREVERCARLGLRGIGELNADAQGWSLEDPDLERVVRPSITADLLWTLHCSDPDRRNHPGKGTANPQRVERLAHRFPDLRIICAHLGGGLPLDSARSGRNGRGAELWPNLWFDTAAAPYLYEPASYKQVVDACGAGRLLFGSDHPLLDAPRYIDALRSAHLDEAEMSLVMGDAAADLLRL